MMHSSESRTMRTHLLFMEANGCALGKASEGLRSDKPRSAGVLPQLLRAGSQPGQLTATRLQGPLVPCFNDCSHHALPMPGPMTGRAAGGISRRGTEDPRWAVEEWCSQASVLEQGPSPLCPHFPHVWEEQSVGPHGESSISSPLKPIPSPP